jgi:hypothetical protein
MASALSRHWSRNNSPSTATQQTIEASLDMQQPLEDTTNRFKPGSGDETTESTMITDTKPTSPSPGSSELKAEKLLTNEGVAFLLVDDNVINLKVRLDLPHQLVIHYPRLTLRLLTSQILGSYMTKLGRPYATALNGLDALEKYSLAPEKYRCIFMGKYPRSTLWHKMPVRILGLGADHIPYFLRHLHASDGWSGVD